MNKCEVLHYIGLGEERICGNVATAILDAGTPDETQVCAACSRYCHRSRLTPIAFDAATAVAKSADELATDDLALPGEKDSSFSGDFDDIWKSAHGLPRNPAPPR